LLIIQVTAVSDILLPDKQRRLIQVQVCQMDETVKYLGSPLRVRKLTKLKFNNGVISKVEGILNKIVTSELKISQIIHAVKSYLLPKLYYVMSNSVMSVTKLSKLDVLIRKHLNDSIGGPALSKDLFYTSWKSGGFVIKNLRERYAVLKLNNAAHFYLRDEETREFIEWQVNEEAKKMKIEIEPIMKGNYFFDWRILTGKE
jgi:hypothetical protein